MGRAGIGDLQHGAWPWISDAEAQEIERILLRQDDHVGLFISRRQVSRGRAPRSGPARHSRFVTRCVWHVELLLSCPSSSPARPLPGRLPLVGGVGLDLVFPRAVALHDLDDRCGVDVDVHPRTRAQKQGAVQRA